MPEPWWQPAVIYHVYLRSYADSNDDGIGDLRCTDRGRDGEVVSGGLELAQCQAVVASVL